MCNKCVNNREDAVSVRRLVQSSGGGDQIIKTRPAGDYQTNCALTNMYNM